MIAYLGSSLNLAEPILDLSPFHLISHPPATSVDAADATALTVLALACIAGGYSAFRGGDPAGLSHGSSTSRPARRPASDIGASVGTSVTAQASRTDSTLPPATSAETAHGAKTPRLTAGSKGSVRAGEEVDGGATRQQPAHLRWSLAGRAEHQRRDEKQKEDDGQGSDRAADESGHSDAS